jgi:hypothetical protein
VNAARVREFHCRKLNAEKRPIMQRVLAGALMGLAMMTLAAAAETITFDKSAVGAPPENFEFARTGGGAAGQWVVVRDDSAADGRALEQSNTDRTSYRFPLAIYKRLSARNVDVSVRFKPISGQVDQAGGIVLRFSDPENYYVVRANALENNVRFYRVVNGRRTQLNSADVRVAANVWHTLGIRADDDRFSISLDGSQLYTANDRTFGKVGKVGVWTKADSVTRFEGLAITSHD